MAVNADPKTAANEGQPRHVVVGEQLRLGSRALTSPRVVRELLCGDLLAQFGRVCNSHKPHSILHQTDNSHPEHIFLSCICTNCRHHIYVEVKSDCRVPFETSHEQEMHMFVITSQKGGDELKKAEQQPRPREPSYLCQITLDCVEPKCSCRLTIWLAAPRLTPVDINMFLDTKRCERHLATAMTEDPQRFVGYNLTGSLGSVQTFLTYLKDALDDESSSRSRQIKLRNKKYLVNFRSDFDHLFQLAGFTLGPVPESADADELCWYFPKLEPSRPRCRTVVGSVRAAAQDIDAELKLLIGWKRVSNCGGLAWTLDPAWTQLQNAVRSKYLPCTDKPSLDPNDVEVLGCLDDYKTVTFCWAVERLSECCPQRRNDFVQAAKRCVQLRGEEGETRLLMFTTCFNEDAQERNGDQLSADAYAHFGVDPHRDFVPADFKNGYMRLAQQGRLSTREDRALATQYLAIISGEIHYDLLGFVTGSEYDDMNRAGLVGNTAMSDAEAARILGIELDYTADMIAGFVNNLAQDGKTNRSEVEEALKTIAASKRSHATASGEEEAVKLEAMAGFWKTEVFEVEPSPPAGPAGLRNIGNTCYLNSLLQYFYHVNPLRKLVLEQKHVQLNLENGSYRDRLTGNGLSVSLDEAIVARQFMESLQSLFQDLSRTKSASTQPSQKLANTALHSAATLLQHQPAKDQSPTKPPPLPARPSPTPTVTSRAVKDVSDTGSNHSSDATLVDANGNVTAGAESNIDLSPLELLESSAPQTLALPASEGLRPKGRLDRISEVPEDVRLPDPKEYLAERMRRISARLEESERLNGTTQQDVEEIIGFILEHIMRAIPSDGPMPGVPKLQSDQITRLFFPTIVNHTIKLSVGDEDNTESAARKEVVCDSKIFAYPHPTKGVSSTIYDALDRNLELQFIPQDCIARYTAIRTLPPILHICLQRTEGSGIKNMNPIILEDDLYMDRYLESYLDSTSAPQRMLWALKKRLSELNACADKDACYMVKALSHPITGAAGSPAAPRLDAKTAVLTVSSILASLHPDLRARDQQRNLSDDSGSESERTVKPNSLKRYSSESSEDSEAKRQARSGRSSDRSSPSGRWSQAKSVGMFDDLAAFTRALGEGRSGERDSITNEIISLYSGMKAEHYCLHAIICHGGGMDSGHYWIWIRDFDKKVWYKFNDDMVTEDRRESSDFLSELSQSGDPYFLAYVRDELKDELVKMPRRAGSPQPYELDEAGDVVMLQTIEGVEPEGHEYSMSHFAKAVLDDGGSPMQLDDSQA